MSAEYEPGHRRPEGLDEADETPPPRRPDRREAGDPDDDPSRVFWLIGGALAIAAGTALGWDATALATVVTPPPLIRAALVGGSAALGVVLLLSALSRLAADEPVDPRVVRRPAGDGLDRPRGITVMVRGVRQVFLAVAAFAAASGWLIGHPLPLIVALVIAGVDVLETTFLLFVVSLHRRG
jgi:hypothetical protein